MRRFQRRFIDRSGERHCIVPSPKATLSIAFMYFFGSDLWRRAFVKPFPVFCRKISATCWPHRVPQTLPNRDASYTPFGESATRTTRLSALEPRRQLHVCGRRLRSRTGTLRFAYKSGVGCPAVVDFVNVSSPNLGAKSPGPTMTARRTSIGDLTR